MTPSARRSGPLTAIGMTLAFGAVLAYCGRVDAPTLVARAAGPEVSVPVETVDAATTATADVVTDATDATAESSDPAVGALAVPLDATAAAAAGVSASTESAMPAAPAVQAAGPVPSSRPIGSSTGSSTGSGAPAGAPTGSAAPSEPTLGAGGATSSSAAAVSTSTTISSASSAAAAAAASVTMVSGATSTTTSPTSTSSSTSTTSTTSTVPSTTTTDRVPAPTTTSTAAPVAAPTTTSAPQAVGPRTVVDIDFEQGSDAASVGLDALSPGPHGVTTDLAIAFGVARARRLDVEVYARTPSLGSADHWVEADLHIGADIAGNYTGVMTRVSASDTGYAWHKLEVWGTWNGFRLLTLVGSRIADEQYFSYRLQPDTTYRVRLEARGSTISGWIDGRPLFEVTAPAVPWSSTAGLNMTASGDPSNSTLDNLRAGPL